MALYVHKGPGDIARMYFEIMLSFLLSLHDTVFRLHSYTCIDCPEGFYGEGCTDSEECECQNGASCDPVTGQCNCTAGWMGETCNKSKQDHSATIYDQHI